MDELLEQAARAFERGGVIRRADAGKLRADAQLVAEGQGLQRTGNALAHLARRLAGEGECQDAARCRTRQQQADDAGGECPGLAGAGSGDDGCTLRWIERGIAHGASLVSTARRSSAGMRHRPA